MPVSYCRTVLSGALLFFAFSSPANGSFPIPPRDGQVLEERGVESLVDDFEASSPRFTVSATNNAPGLKVSIRNGIEFEGVRSLHVTSSAPLKGRSNFSLCWKFPEPADFSANEGFAYRINLQKPVSRIRIIVCEKTNYSFWYADTFPDPARLNEWQRVEIPSRFSWIHGGGRSPEQDRKTSNLKEIVFLRFDVSGATQDETAFGLDEIGFVAKVAHYDGIVAKLGNWGQDLVHWRTNAPFRLVAGFHGKAQEKDLRARFYTIDYHGAETNLVLDKTVKAGTTNLWAGFTVPSKGPGFGRIIGVVYDGTNPLYRTSRGYTTIQGLHPEDDGRNPDSIFGIWVGGDAWIRMIGAKWRRMGLRGHEVKFPDKENPLNPPYENVLRKRPEGLDSFLCFVGMPKWLSSRPKETEAYKFPPADYALYGEYLKNAMAVNKDNFEFYEIWNEPVPWAGWRGNVDELVRLSETTWKSVHAAKPDARVLGPGGYSFLPEFTEEFFKKGGGKWIDGVVVHGYTPAPPDKHFVEGLREFKSILARYGQSDKNIYITEMGYATPSVTEEDMASFLVRCYMYAWEEGVRVMIWHNLRCWSEYPPAFDLQWRDGTPRPAFTAYAVMTRELEGAKLVSRLSGLPSPSHVAFAFERRGVRTVVAWDKNVKRGEVGTPLELKFEPFSLVAIVDIVGGERTVKLDESGSLSIRPGRDPVYVRQVR